MMVIANGTYRARGVRATLGETSNGNERVVVDFELLDEGYEDQHIAWFGYFTEKTFETTVKALRTCGWKGADLTDLSGIDANEVALVIENETWEGRVRPRVRWVNAPSPMDASALKEQKARQFAAKMKARIVALDQAAAQKPSANNRVTETIGDDLPF